MELLRRLAGCRFGSNVICGLWDKSPERCGRCEYNPNIVRSIPEKRKSPRQKPGARRKKVSPV